MDLCDSEANAFEDEKENHHNRASKKPRAAATEASLSHTAGGSMEIDRLY
jgi:hypothetical protein